MVEPGLAFRNTAQKTNFEIGFELGRNGNVDGLKNQISKAISQQLTDAQLKIRKSQSLGTLDISKIDQDLKAMDVLHGNSIRDLVNGFISANPKQNAAKVAEALNDSLRDLIKKIATRLSKYDRIALSFEEAAERREKDIGRKILGDLGFDEDALEVGTKEALYRKELVARLEADKEWKEAMRLKKAYELISERYDKVIERLEIAKERMGESSQVLKEATTLVRDIGKTIRKELRPESRITKLGPIAVTIAAVGAAAALLYFDE